jgi:hypothetical protein
LLRLGVRYSYFIALDSGNVMPWRGTGYYKAAFTLTQTNRPLGSHGGGWTGWRDDELWVFLDRQPAKMFCKEYSSGIRVLFT